MPDKIKILVIDDEEDICKFSKSILEKTGRFAVSTTTKGQEGIELAKSQRPDLILLDIFMPDMDGGEVANRLAKFQHTQNIPIVFLTALATKDDVDENTGKIGKHHFIAKPVTGKELISRIESVLGR